jgi:hypothetical protein
MAWKPAGSDASRLPNHKHPVATSALTGKYRNLLFLGTRMNTDYQDIEGYIKPNICGNLWKSVS